MALLSTTCSGSIKDVRLAEFPAAERLVVRWASVRNGGTNVTPIRRFSLEAFVTAGVGLLAYRLLNTTIGWLSDISPLLLAMVLCMVLLARLIVLRRRTARPAQHRPA